ncbi:MAG TPA: phage baseplate assembly protein V [Gemmatimonadales bacterium]|jgi:uncharacterized protein involved in type VI secretion and phage assembly
MSQKYYGKYRGVVVNNVDPMKIGRLQASVADVAQALPTSWAMPCVPVAGISMGAYFVPPVGAGVWIEFEQGDPDYPIWSGCFWGSAAEVPALALAGNPVSPSIVLQTQLQNTIVISDLPGPAGGIILKSATGAAILINTVGITLTNGAGATLVMAGPTVTINNGALVVI